MRDIVLQALIDELENCESNGGCIHFKTYNINTDHNNNVINKHYPLLRKMYKLSAPTRRPKKFTSQTLLQISKHEKFDINRKTTYIKNKDLNKNSTFGFYRIDTLNNNPVV